MKSVIEEIYYKFWNDIKPSEEYWKIHDKLADLSERIAKSLPDELKTDLNELYLLSGGTEAEQAKTCFIEGFKMGMRIAIEALKD